MNKKALRGKKKLMYEAMTSQLGVVTAATNQVGINRTTHYKWLKEDENYRIWIEELPELTGDFVENALLRQIKSGNTACIIFYCKTKLKNRGYIEQQNIKTEHSGSLGISQEDVKKLLEVL